MCWVCGCGWCGVADVFCGGGGIWGGGAAAGVYTHRLISSNISRRGQDSDSDDFDALDERWVVLGGRLGRGTGERWLASDAREKGLFASLPCRLRCGAQRQQLEM